MSIAPSSHDIYKASGFISGETAGEQGPGITAAFKINLGNFTLDIEVQCPGTGLTAVVGPSGSGKTTFLKCLAGLIQAPGGHLVVNGEVWQNEQKFLPTYKRPLGYVFQDASLFPHLSVEGNLEYGRKRSKNNLSQLNSQEVLDVLNIRHLLKRPVHNLSGGEAQRVAMARALFRNPELLVLDEPLASLDSTLKSEIIPYINTLKNFHLPIIYVTHAEDEVRKLADYCLCFKNGKIIEKIYAKYPSNI